MPLGRVNAAFGTLKNAAFKPYVRDGQSYGATENKADLCRNPIVVDWSGLVSRRLCPRQFESDFLLH